MTLSGSPMEGMIIGLKMLEPTPLLTSTTSVYRETFMQLVANEMFDRKKNWWKKSLLAHASCGNNNKNKYSQTTTTTYQKIIINVWIQQFSSFATNSSFKESRHGQPIVLQVFLMCWCQGLWKWIWCHVVQSDWSWFVQILTIVLLNALLSQESVSGGEGSSSCLLVSHQVRCDSNGTEERHVFCVIAVGIFLVFSFFCCVWHMNNNPSNIVRRGKAAARKHKFHSG